MNSAYPFNSQKWYNSVMPSFNKTTVVMYGSHSEEISRFRMEAIPLGFRGTPGLSWLLHLTPYITGSKPKFRVRVTRISSLIDTPFMVNMRCVGAGRERAVIANTSYTIREYFSQDFQDMLLSDNAKFSYILELAQPHITDVYRPTIEAELVSFKTIYQETITLWVSGIIIGFLVSLLTWLITNKH